MTIEKRHAFLIGNSNYKVQAFKLDSPKLDVDAFSKALRECGFDVLSLIDASSQQIRDAFEEFRSQAKGANVALLYYSGHGLQYGDGNILVPIDTPTSLAGLLEKQPVRIESLVEETNELLRSHSGGREHTCLVFLDACRSNPASPARENAQTLAKRANLTGSTTCGTCGLQVFAQGLSEIRVDAETETFIAYATSPGAIAEGTVNGLSRFTERIEKYLNTPGLSIDELMRWVADAVGEDTRGQQRPWKHDNLTRTFLFKRADSTPIIVMGILGLVVGLLSACLSFNKGKYIPFDVSDLANTQWLAGAPFSAVIAYGVMKWGRGTWWSGLAAFAVTYLSWIVANITLAPAVGEKSLPCHDAWLEVVNDPAFLVQLNAVFASGMIYSVGILAAGAISSSAQRQVKPFALAISTGIAVVMIYVAVTMLLRVFHVINCDTTGNGETLAIYVATGVWDGMLAAMSGYAYWNYVPSSWKEAEAEALRPAADFINGAEARLMETTNRLRNR